MTKATADFTGWEFFDVYDNLVPAGAFVSPTRQDITVNVCGKDVTVTALNWFHAVYVAYKQVAAETGGSLSKCELCGANLRYAALFEGPGNTMHVVGRECCKRVQDGVENRDEWAIVSAMKDAKEINTKNGLRWKVDLLQPAGFDRIPYADRPTYVSTWRPKLPPMARSRGSMGNPRVTIWAGSQEELYAKVSDFRNWLKGMHVGMAQKVTRRGF
jgi:hypothetical protein